MIPRGVSKKKSQILQSLTSPEPWKRWRQ
jgi:hypothetical protein